MSQNTQVDAGGRLRGVPLVAAWQRALYGENGFYRLERPAEHFRTASHAAAGLLAGPVLRLAALAGCGTVVDVGAGSGELLTALAGAAPAEGLPGLQLHGVDLRPRPAGLPAPVTWSQQVPPLPAGTLLIGWELLDNIPCPVLQADDTGTLREVWVSPAGDPVPGPAPRTADLDWCRRWWPGPWQPGQPVEVGRARDAFWADLTGRLDTGLALAVDYDHDAAARPWQGTLLGYQHGQACPPAFDGSVDVTAHVALDAVVAAAGGRVLRQRDVLAALGLTRQPVPHELARTDPVGYLQGLDRDGQVRELLDPAGLGGFGWALTPRGEQARQAVTGLDRVRRAAGPRSEPR